MSNLGFTGSREGLRPKQLEVLQKHIIFWYAKPEEHFWHDGNCVGADTQAHEIVDDLKATGFKIETIGHPCSLKRLQANNPYDITRPILSPMVRNHRIAEESHILLVGPKEMTETLRSGTWATARYATKLGNPVLIVYPDGTTESRNGYYRHG